MTDPPPEPQVGLERSRQRALSTRSEAFARRGLQLAAELDGLVPTGPGPRFVLAGHSECVQGVAFSPEGRRIASASWDGTVRLWDARRGVPRGVLRGHEGRVSSVVFSPDGSCVASAGWDGTVRLWEIHGGQEVRCFRDEREIGIAHCVALSPSGDLLALAAASPAVYVWSLVSSEQPRRIPTPAGPVRWVRFTPDGEGLLVACGGSALGTGQGFVALIAAADGKVRWSIPSGATFLGLALSGDGRHLLASSGGPARGTDNVLRLVDVRAGRELRRWRSDGGAIYALRFRSGSRECVLAARDGVVRLLECAGERELFRLEGHREAAYALDLSPDGRLAVSGGADRTVRVWSLPDARQEE